MKTILSNLKSALISGLLVVIPLVITILVLKSIITSVDNIFRPFLEPELGFWPHGLGILITFLIILLAGLLVSNIIIKRVVQFGENLLYKIPIAKVIYSAVKQLLETVSKTEKQSFQRVVLVEYPSSDIWSVGFVNGEMYFKNEAEKKLKILVLASINPTSGFFIIVPESKTIPINISVEDGMKWVITGGLIKPDGLQADRK